MTPDNAPLNSPKPCSINYTLSGVVNERIQNGIDNWLLTTPLANPIIIEMFNHRDQPNRYTLMAWAGEFAGKYLTSCVLTLRLGRNAELYNSTQRFVKDLIATQDPSGYLGPWSVEERLYGKFGYERKWFRKKLTQTRVWDFWGHYHCIYGLILWYQQTGDVKSLETCEKAMIFLYISVVEKKQPVSLARAEEMNMAIYHGSLLLYKLTLNPKYLEFANHVEQDFQTPGAGDYLRLGLMNVPFSKTPKPRWESLHAIQGLAEKYYITDDSQYKRAFESLWWSMLRDRHNTGGWSSGEKATGNPYDPKAIETCCTVAWIAVTVEMLKLTKDSRIADELELSTYNGIFGGQHPSGRWWTYDTPMEGFKRAAMDHINFQAHPGGPELNCCSVNGPRGPGMISEWAILLYPGAIYINYYGPGRYTFQESTNKTVTIKIEGNYPISPEVELSINRNSDVSDKIYLRIPQWSEKTLISYHDREDQLIESGEYFEVNPISGWTETRISLKFDFSPHYWIGGGIFDGKIAVYFGPLLLALDSRYNPGKLGTLHEIDLNNLNSEKFKVEKTPDSWISVKISDQSGRILTFTDYSSTGFFGSRFTTWINSRGLNPMEPSFDEDFLNLWNRRVS